MCNEIDMMRMTFDMIENDEMNEMNEILSIGEPVLRIFLT